MAGPQRRTRLMSDKEKKVTGLPRGRSRPGRPRAAEHRPGAQDHDPAARPALGYTMVLPTEDKYSQSRAELMDQLAYAMGGRAAEELVFHDPTTGASNDIEKATATARAMVTQYGMSERLGAVKFGQESGEVFMGKDMGHGRDYSEEIAAQVDAEVRGLVENAHHEAWEILVEHRDVLDDMVLKLLDKETLGKDEIAEVFAPVAKRPCAPHPTGNGRRPLSTRPPVLTPAELAVMGPADLQELEDLARGRTGDGAPKPSSRRRAPAAPASGEATAPSRARASANRTASAPRKATGPARAASPTPPPAQQPQGAQRSAAPPPAVQPPAVQPPAVQPPAVQPPSVQPSAAHPPAPAPSSARVAPASPVVPRPSRRRRATGTDPAS
jgi:hypothetical protein